MRICQDYFIIPILRIEAVHREQLQLLLLFIAIMAAARELQISYHLRCLNGWKFQARANGLHLSKINIKWQLLFRLAPG